MNFIFFRIYYLYIYSTNIFAMTEKQLRITYKVQKV